MLLNLVYKTESIKGFDGLVQVEATATIKDYLKGIKNQYKAIPTSSKDKFDNFVGGIMCKKDLEDSVFLKVVSDEI